MNPFEFLFAFLSKFITFPPGRLSEIKDKAFNWKNQQTDKDTPVGKLLKKGDEWWVQILLAIAFLIGVKKFGEWMMSTTEPDDLAGDEDDEDEEPTPVGRKFKLNV